MRGERDRRPVGCGRLFSLYSQPRRLTGVSSAGPLRLLQAISGGGAISEDPKVPLDPPGYLEYVEKVRTQFLSLLRSLHENRACGPQNF
jgi:hypothetical protein